ASDVKSKTAYDVMLNNCTAVTPYKNEVYPGSTPRAMVISAFRNVQINNFTAIGDGTFTAGNPVIAVQYRAENVTFNGLNIRGFKNASADVQIYGGGNRPKKITISNFNIIDSSSNTGIANGSRVYDTKIIGGNMQGQGTGTAIFSYNNNTEIIGVNAEKYTNQADLAGRLYKIMPTVTKGGFSAASTGAGALAQRSAIIASSGGSFAHSDRSFVIGSGAGSQAHGSRSGVINSLESETLPGSYAQTIVNSRGVKSRGVYSVLMGYGTDGPRYENTTIDMSPISGNIQTKGTVSSGQNFGDYAEYFESQSGQAIPNGTIVTLDGRFIRKAQ
ncbi:peptidase G2 autoproteolytic cleavage domain-containing protein, partial [Staphylococcus sp. GDK8D68P]|uniref:peptidase G2 autoproteolytic cleavage domain-containing protein n=1 Tax=Staphylococcus sp. GDK8D68P TaxID=2804092 RepID=UPI002479700C